MAESGTLTLSQLRTYAKYRSNLENSTFVTDDEWNSYINLSLQELYDLIIQKYGNDYYATSVTIGTDGTSYLFALPNGTNYSAAAPFYKFLGLDLQLAANQQDSWTTIRNFSFQERNRYAVPNFQSFYGVTNLRYRLNGNNLWLTPIPQSGQTLRLWYIPRNTQLVSDSDIADGFGGWLEYVIIDAAMKAMIKQELDIQPLMAEKQMMMARLESVAENRDAGNPARVTDAASSDYGFPTGNGNGWGSY